MKSTKLSTTQRDVLMKLANGWEIGKSILMNNNGSWLQKGGAGHGGETAKLSLNTFYALWDRKLIDGKYEFPTSRYNITPAGRDALARRPKP